jgi:hypothetical protein
MMESSFAFCGLDCGNCPIHLATLEADPDVKASMRIDIADMLARIYKTTPKPEIISDCDGCRLVNGRLFTGCANCEIRKCATDKNLGNCAYCSEYACDRLKRHFSFDPGAQINLERIRSRHHVKKTGV